MTLVIGNKNYSSWSLRPWLYLKHFGIPFSEIKIALYGERYKEKILETSPSGKVPALKDGDLIIWDSLAIMEYLADKFPALQSWPKNIQERAVARSVSAEMHSGFFGLREHLPMNCRKTLNGFTPPDKAIDDIDRVKQIWTNCRKQFGHKGPWLFGEFSIADCMYAPVVMRFETYRIETSPIIDKYCQTVKQHPAMLEWNAAAREESDIIEESEID